MVKEVIPRVENIPFLIKNEPFRFYTILNKNFDSGDTLQVNFSYFDTYDKQEK